MPITFATPADVALAWRALTPAETSAAEFYIEFASELIRSEIPSIDERIIAGTLSPVLVKGVVVQMVKRTLMNPEGYRTVQESIEDYSTTMTRDSALSTGGLYLSADELAILSSRRKGAFSITPHNEPATSAINTRIAENRAWRDR